MNTSAASKGPSTQRLGTKLRDISDRQRNLENRRARKIRVGAWVLSEDANGSLVATHGVTGKVQTLATKEND